MTVIYRLQLSDIETADMIRKKANQHKAIKWLAEEFAVAEKYYVFNSPISSFELVDDFVCLHSVYSGIDGRVSRNDVWPFIAMYAQSVLANTKRDKKIIVKSMKKYLLSGDILIIFQHPSEMLC